MITPEQSPSTSLRNTTVVVTGGAGFIGSHLSKALLDTDAHVHVIDNLSSGKKENIPTGAVFHKGDIRHLPEILKIFKKIGKIDYVFHLAAIPEVEVSKKYPQEVKETNVVGTDNVLRASCESSVGRFIFASSAAVYGNTVRIPIDENTPLNPSNPYGFHKLIGEHYCAMYSGTCGLKTVCLRYFNVYGPNQPVKSSYSGVISIFLQKAKNKEPLLVTGDGSQTRDFIHVSDIVSANMLAAVSDKVGNAEVINIGSGTGSSIKSIAELVSQNITYTTPREEVRDSVANIGKAKTLLAWYPRKSLREGLAELKKSVNI
jgi:UDP-glucose 4-epimerase